MNWITEFFADLTRAPKAQPRNSVSSVLASFEQTIADLDAIKEQQDAEISRQVAIEAAAGLARVTAKKEAYQAAAAAASFRQLIGQFAPTTEGESA